MATRDDRTDRFRTVFEPEDIFDRFVKNANASVEEVLPADDDVTGCISRDTLRREPEVDESAALKERRGGPPTWDHQITVVNNDDKPATPSDEETTAVGPRPGDGEPTEEIADGSIGKPMSSSTQVTTDSGQKILLLTKVKHTALTDQVLDVEDDPANASSWQSVVAPRGLHTQKVEADKVVPDVAAAAKKQPGTIAESAEDGQMPTRQLDQILGDMAVLLRYGHGGQVRERLEQLRRTYPEDLLLLRAIAEFHIEHEQRDAALDTLFALAGGLFERRNVEGMRQALEQVLIFDPDNARAFRLLGLLEKRPDGTDD